MQGKEEDRQREKDRERERERERDADKVDEDSSSGMTVLKKISTIASSFMQVAYYSDHPIYSFIYLFIYFEDAPHFLLPLSYVYAHIFHCLDSRRHLLCFSTFFARCAG